MATAALYRILRAATDKTGADAEELKKIILYAIFWSVRELIGSSVSYYPFVSEKKHPSWHIRLHYMIDKLAMMDMPSPESGLSDEHKKHIDELVLLLIGCEKHYIDSQNITMKESTLIEYMNSALIDKKDDSVKSLIKLWWDEAEPIVMRKKRLLPEQIISRIREEVPLGSRAKVVIMDI